MENEDPYEKFLIKRYRHWGLYLHAAQFPYVGRCYASANRQNADVVTDMSADEREELFELVVPEWKNGVHRAFPMDRENLAIF